MSKKMKRTTGLGLGEMFGVSSELPHLIEVDVSILQPNPDQPRQTFDKKALRGLANSIEQHGLLQPIAVKKVEGEDGYIIVAGERRFRAFQILKRTTIPAILTDGDSRELALIENIQREDLHPMELAEGLAKMIEHHGYKQRELGKIVDKAQNTISEILRLNSLQDEIKQEYRSTDIPRAVVVEISRIAEPAEQLSFWKKAKRGMSLREAREARRGKKASGRPSPGARALSAGERFIASLDRAQLAGGVQEEELVELSRIHKVAGARLRELKR